MKKFLAILLIMVYGTASSGATIHLHYCMGKFACFGLSAEKKETCYQCGMNKGNNDCCKDVKKTFKTLKDYNSPGFSFNLAKQASPVLQTDWAFIRQDLYSSNDRLTIFANGPPESIPIPLYTRFCNFRI
ncbi:HYC_CC_PP family protein [Flavitalea flava]